MTSRIVPISEDNIKVSYVGNDGVLIENVSVSDANDYEKLNPGTIFVFVDGDNNIRYLNIEQVNSLTSSNLISTKSFCDTSPKPARSPIIIFSGGGGIGAEANPIISPGGVLLGIDIVNPGVGYQTPPTITVIDEANVGSGAVVQAVVENGYVVDGIVLDSGSNYIPAAISATPSATVSRIPPTANITASSTSDGAVTISWSTTNANTLTSNFGDTRLSGSRTFRNQTPSRTFSITVTNSSGSVTKSVTTPATPSAVAPPTANITASSTGDGAVTISWSTTNANTLTSNFGDTRLSGSRTFRNQTPSRTFSITVTNSSGSVTKSVTSPAILDSQIPRYPAILSLKEVIVNNPGINYNPEVDVVEITPNNGTILQAVYTPFGQVTGVKVVRPGIGFVSRPNITIRSESGINADFTPVFEIIRDPILFSPQLQQRKIITVIDTIGLQIQGYVNGKPYYGNIYYDGGLKYAGPYKSFDTEIRVYDTLSESIK